MMTDEQFKEELEKYLEIFDEIFQEQKIPIPDRFFEAGHLFLKNAITEVKGPKSPEKIEEAKSLILSESILPICRKWYIEKYGTLAIPNKKDYYSGIVTQFSEPILLHIPDSTRKVDESSETYWFTIPNHLLEDENIQDMIKGPLDWDKLSDDQQKSFKKDLAEIVRLSRQINVNIKYYDKPDNDFGIMGSGVWSHFEKAVADIVTRDDNQASIGYWELHLAIEKTMKVYLSQKTGQSKYTHDLKALAKKIVLVNPELKLDKLNELPSDKDALKCRYGEKTYTVHQVIEFYKTALIIVETISADLNRKIVMKNVSFQIKPPTWAL